MSTKSSNELPFSIGVSSMAAPVVVIENTERPAARRHARIIAHVEVLPLVPVTP